MTGTSKPEDFLHGFGIPNMQRKAVQKGDMAELVSQYERAEAGFENITAPLRKIKRIRACFRRETETSTILFMNVTAWILDFAAAIVILH